MSARENFILKIIISEGDNKSLPLLMNKETFIFDNEQNAIIFEYIKDYFNKFDKIPSFKAIRSHLVSNKDTKSEKQLKILEDTELIDTSAAALIEQDLNDYAKSVTLSLISETKNNLKIGGEASVRETIRNLTDKLTLVSGNTSIKESTQGVMQGEASIERFKRRYQKAKKMDHHYIGKFGIDKLDETLGGYTKRDMVNIMGFTNQGKSPFLRKIAYEAMCQGLNVLFVPLETGRDETENFFYVLHANNFKRFGTNVPRITNKKLREGRLNKKEEDFMMEVITDYNTAEDLGNIYVLQPNASTYSMDDLMSDLKKIDYDLPIDVLVLDYISLLRPDSRSRYIDTQMINQMHTRMRQEMLSFNGGDGFTYIGACQVNRKGFKDMLADKEHLYDLTAIGDYNSIERDSTLIFSIARTPEDEAARLARVQCLKARDNKKPMPFQISFDGETGNFYGTSLELSEEDALQELDELEI